MVGHAVITIVGVGAWGCQMLNGLASDVIAVTNVVAIDTDPLVLATCGARTLVLAEEDWASWGTLSAEPCSGFGRLQAAVADSNLVFLLGDPRETTLHGLWSELSSLCLAWGFVTAPVCPVSLLTLNGLGRANSLSPLVSFHQPMTIFIDASGGDAGLVPILCQAICGVILTPSMIGVDFADVRAVLDEPGFATASMSMGSGDNRALCASRAVLSEGSAFSQALSAARAVLAVIMVSDDPPLDEFTIVGDWVSRYASADATVIMGIVVDPSIDASELKLFMLAAGIENLPPVSALYSP